MSILVINGPNLNTLGQRQPDIYGKTTLADIETTLKEYADTMGVTLLTFQSNSEGAIIDFVQQHTEGCTGIVINAGAFSHTSVAIRDCLVAVGVPVVSVHISNIYAREEFRHRDIIAPVARGLITGLGTHGYLLALDYLAELANRGGKA
ncbi:MAG: type II 3-dehydroquinate dehydratase [SAR202 cluster bacterium]|nr:type II 3-dehydroquinate dehydratase [SAR202 cluster bacterium]